MLRVLDGTVTVCRTQQSKILHWLASPRQNVIILGILGWSVS